MYTATQPKKLNVVADLKHLFLASKFSLTHVPFYVGKGTGDRWLKLDRNDSHRKIRSYLIKQGLDIVPIKVVSKITHSKALEIEAKLIDILGLQSLSKFGMLVNLDEGSDAKIRRGFYSALCQQILKKNGYGITVAGSR